MKKLTTDNAGIAGRRASRTPAATGHPRRGQAGFTLVEVLVAVTVTAVIFVVAFSLYDNLQRSFKLSENAATQQQNTRAAFDRLVADVRMAGFNYNPDGDINRPDEQIEGMWTTAVTVRGDYDFEDAAERTSPESTLGGTGMTFRTVSTGNDEIVTYGLGKPDGTGGVSISFAADVTGVPRNGSLETVTITNVHLTQDNPPYTLYRYIVAPNSVSVVKQPVADNLKTLTFTYLSGAVDPNTGTPEVLAPIGGAEDAASLAVRKRISKVRINVVGMTEDPDLAYIDPTDATSATRHYRKFTLETDVTPRNLGMVGVVDIDLNDPNAPTNFTVCQGHCNGSYLHWDSGGDPDVNAYMASWGTSLSNMVNVVSTIEENHYITPLSGPHYYAVRAIDMVGNSSPNVVLGPSTPNDTTTPAQVTGAAATGDAGSVRAPVKNQVDLSWSGIAGNTVNLSCDESPYPIRDLGGYRVYKGATATFDPNVPAQVIQSWDPNSVGASVNTLADAYVVNCRLYYYKVRGEDLCAKQGALSVPADGASTTDVPPAAPMNLQATDMGLGLHRLVWDRVSQDTDAPPSPILIDKYKVFRAVVPVGDDPNQGSYSEVFSGFVTNASSPSWDATSVSNIPSSQRYYYKVAGLDDCPNTGVLSIPDEVDKCSLGGSIDVTMSPGGPSVTGNQTITVTHTPGITVVNTRLVIKNATTGVTVYDQTDGTSPYQYLWNASSVPAGQTYLIAAFVTNDAGCTDSVTSSVATMSVIACCISPTNPNLSPTTGSLKNNEVFFDIVNNCGDDVLIQKMVMAWTNNLSQNALLTEVNYNIFDFINPGRDIIINPDAPPAVTLDFTGGTLAPELRLSKNNDDTSPVRLRYVFTQPMLGRSGPSFVGETIRTDFFFTVASQSGAGRCELNVVTNPLSVVGCDPASDPNCGI